LSTDIAFDYIEQEDRQTPGTMRRVRSTI